MKLSIETSELQGASEYNWIAKVDSVKYDAFKMNYPGSVVYAKTEESAYNQLKDNLEKRAIPL
ncbi:hypothetical protein Phi46:3_gp057 [Cellulophaga phage phi46:3]|uniref:Uncharacterized protein n=1 Tax=Cellulophaga phage phi46:3 TaxID=1327985 RepID=S0A0A1_9CAUD|nr:hypothetical protein Phi46:3_gp057 [Cellulophaga phage phi46:3]AGO48801.1 hypothetical protein Phi46:3_gp057 [Cellulophaga phage phi46:3]